MLGIGFGISTLATQSHKPLFSPLDLASLATWYDPSDLSTLFQDVAGTIAATSDGDQVRLMLDKSGQGKSATHVVTNTPILRISGGKTWLEFNNSAGFVLPANIFETLEYSIFLGFGKTVNVMDQLNSYPHLWRTANDAQSFFMRSSNGHLELKSLRVGGSDVRPLISNFDTLHSVGGKAVIAAGVSLTSGAIFLDGMVEDAKANSGSAITDLSSASELMSNIEGQFFGAVLLKEGVTSGARIQINTYLTGKF